MDWLFWLLVLDALYVLSVLWAGPRADRYRGGLAAGLFVVTLVLAVLRAAGAA